MEQPEQNIVAQTETETRLPKPAALQDTRSAAAAPTGAEVFKTKSVSIYYGSFRAVTDVTLDIHENEITAFIGPSGCGKSTVLRCLNRMNDLIDGARIEGSCSYHGVDLYDPERRRDRAAAPDRHGVPEAQPVPQVDLRERRLRPADRRHRNEASSTRSSSSALRGAALWDEVKDRLQSRRLGLSGGQQQRLCIARAIAVEPEVILMDEPCSALDPIATARIEDLMQRAARAATRSSSSPTTCSRPPASATARRSSPPRSDE